MLYYWGEIGLDISNDGTIVKNRIRCFAELEVRGNFFIGQSL
jgi:uncharacterized NAD(P)/FAD-binding protein YdhS